MEWLEFEGVFQALGVYAEVGFLQGMERVMEEFVLLATCFYLGHQFFLLLVCILLWIFKQYLWQLLQQLQKLPIIQIPGSRAYPYIYIMQLLLRLWFLREDLVLLEEMHQFLVVHGLGFVLDPLEALLDTG